MKSMKKRLAAMGLLALMIVAFCSVTAFAASTDDAAPATAVTTQATTETTSASSADNTTGSKAVAAGVCVGLAAGAGALGMGIAVGKSCEGISRQPEATGQIRTSLMLGLVFIETAIIYALIVAILVIFVL